MHALPDRESPIDLVDYSQRLRYEAFSYFATQVNQATTLEQVSQAMARHVKFILDAFLLRFLHVYDHTEMGFEMGRGKCVVHQPEKQPEGEAMEAFRTLEVQLLLQGLPLQVEQEQLRNCVALKGSLFDHPKVTRFFALPLLMGENHRAVLSVASKEASPFGSTDFRLIRLIAELLSGKLSQLRLAAKVAQRNQQLGEANEELVTLNGQIKGLNLVLEQRVADRTSQLQQASQELYTIFYRTSHDFRRPLMTLLGLLNLAQITAQGITTSFRNQLPDPDEAIGPQLSDLLHLFSQGRTVVGELDAMLSKLSTLSVLQAPAHQREPVDFEKLLGELREKFAPELTRYKVQFSVRIGVTLPFYGNSNSLSIILENLLENAIQFRRADPVVKLHVYTRADSPSGSNYKSTGQGQDWRIDQPGVDLPGKGNWLVVESIDNGEGIHPDWRDKIFDLYVRASERAQGNGLGLYVVRKSVEQLKGTITVESEPAKGAVFKVQLPY